MASTRRSSLLAFVALLGSATFPAVRAQGTNATCQAQFDWMNNEKSQSPCLVTAYLLTPCLANAADAYVFSLPDGFHYRPPTIGSATACQCNTVFYSVIQSCALCQSDPIIPWSTWNTNCTAAIYQSVYPETIPSGTSIPAWAYLDVATSDNFNITAAQLNQQEGHPESTASGPSSTSSGAGSPSSTAQPSSSGKHSNTGAIVGGVVGGLGGAAILAAVAFFFWRKYRRNSRGVNASNGTSTDSNTFAPGVFDGSEKATSQPYTITPLPISSPSPAPGMNTAGVGAGYVPGKIYDPNDPSTFPTAGADPSIHTAQSPTMYSQSLYPAPSPPPQAPYQQQYTVPRGGQYTGAPEV
ncbi:hypothetical protein EIP91_007931 [Steccherinum ochraceum]|uniref:Mid2 domain-containing protein n=1 Tax=Steccherinum ochraceum TaxID=92696 RepID=A0A4R0RSR4_9APHY|nr:hypothetical protein EIP91_007931 [Steccherinum ochraceum]